MHIELERIKLPTFMLLQLLLLKQPNFKHATLQQEMC
jgi:hypothetical protein